MTLYCPECSTTYSDEALNLCPEDGARLYRMDGATSDPLIGAVLDGRFRIDDVLGQGGMGTVYRGVQLSIHREVAVKVLRAELTDREVALERFFREAKVISGLSHPNIVRLIDFGQDRERDLLYLVMELVQGYNLGDLIREGRLRTSIALDVLYQACGALTEPHHAGVIHRDLKPDNILLVPMSDGTVQTKVLDFGIARVLEQNTQITATGMICGTPAYMAPEQAQNDELDPRTDLYSLGVIMYEMLTGWPPFSGTSSLQIMLKHIQETPQPISELVPPSSVIPAVAELAHELMQKERGARPISARDVRERVDSIRRKIDLDRPRIESGMTLEDIRRDWLLPKLPSRDPSYERSGPTEALRRETGIEHLLTMIDGQDSDAYHTDDNFPTIPLEKNDARVKVPTRKGAQQAWTPGDQDALSRRAHTPNQEFDVFGATAAIETPASSASVRKTVVEESPSTDETSPVPPETRVPQLMPGHQSTDRSRPPLQPESTLETRRRDVLPSIDARQITMLNIMLGFVALAAAGAVIYFVKDNVGRDKAAEAPGEVVESTELASVPTPQAKDEGGAATGIVIELTQNKVALAVSEGQGALRAVELESKSRGGGTNAALPRRENAPKTERSSTTKPTPTKIERTGKPEEISEEDIFGAGLREH